MYQTSSPYIASRLAQYHHEDLLRSAARERVAKDARRSSRAIGRLVPFRQSRTHTSLAGPITLRGA